MQSLSFNKLEKMEVHMNTNKFERLSPQEMHKILLANAKLLTSERFNTKVPELVGQRKASIPTT